MAYIHYHDNKVIITAYRTIFEFDYNSNINPRSLTLIKSISLSLDSYQGKLNDNQNEPSDKKLKCDNGSTRRKLDENGDEMEDSDLPQILFSVLSPDSSVLAIVMSSKICFIYRRSDWIYQCSPFMLPKTPTSGVFTSDGNYLILSDRAGFVRRYNIGQNYASKEANEGEILLGHISMVLDVKLSDNGRFLLSADRDEKLRVSRYPQSFVIHCFCLGHSSFIKSIISTYNIAFSAGGDNTIRAWNIDTGENIATALLSVNKNVKFIRHWSFDNVVRIAIIFEQCFMIKIFDFHIENIVFDELFSIDLPENILDITFIDKKSLLSITRSSLFFILLNNDNNVHIEEIKNIDGIIVISLNKIKDEILCLQKKVVHENLKNYLERKRKRNSKKYM